jgi:hypothetical protein
MRFASDALVKNQTVDLTAEGIAAAMPGGCEAAATAATVTGVGLAFGFLLRPPAEAVILI